jgi:hypothetical protein
MSRKKVRQEEQASRRFAMWLRKGFAVICDRDARLEHGCRVVWIDCGAGPLLTKTHCGVGTLLTRTPAKAKRLTIAFDYQSRTTNPTVHVPKKNVARVIGEYEALTGDGPDSL